LEYEKAAVMKSLEIPSQSRNDNLNTTQTPEYTKDKYNAKIRVSPKVPSTTYVGQRME
jgi:hypothetical protein